MVKVNGAQLIVRALDNQGVNVIFTLCGDNDLIYNYCSSLSDETRYDKYAEAFNCYGELVSDSNEIRPALQRVFDSNLPAVIDVRINPKVNTVMDYLAREAYNPDSWKRKVKKKTEIVLEVPVTKS